MNDCWNRIGVRGDGSCAELKQHVHCRNCPVYSASAIQLLERDSTAQDLVQWTTHFAQLERVREQNTGSIMIFRIGDEWLALPTPAIAEVANILPIHSLPHRPSGVVLGLTSVRGELLVCISLGRMLGFEPVIATVEKGVRKVHQRLLVVRREHVRAVCPVDEVHGIHRFHPRELKSVPATIARSAATYSKAVLPWQGHAVGVLDDEPIFHMLKRSVA
jgi:chemotaxis-related protein WspD